MADWTRLAFPVLIASGQTVLAVMMLAPRRRSAWSWSVAGIFLASSLDVLLRAVFGNVPYVRFLSVGYRLSFGYQGLDETIFVLFIALALTFPDPPARLRPWGLAALLAAVVVAIAAVWVVGGEQILYPRSTLSPLTPLRLLLGYVLPCVAWTLLLARWSWRWWPLPAGERGTFQWLFAAFGMRAANILTVTLPVRQSASWNGLLFLARTANWLAFAAAAGALLTLCWSFGREGGAERRQTRFVIAFLVAGYLEAFAAFPAGGSSAFFSDFFVQADILIVRPVLVWCAMATQGSGVARGRWLGPGAVGALVLVGVAQGVRPGLSGALPRWEDAVSLALGAAFAILAVASARAFLSRPAAAQPAAWLPGQRVLGRYRLQAFLGEGSTGQAYLALDPATGQEVVLKRTRNLDAGQRQALLAEAQAVSGLRHPRILALRSLDLEGDEPVLVLEYAPGGSLATRMAASGVPATEALRLTAETLEGLAAAHEAGLVHGDIKPSNILLDADGHVKVADFGSATDLLAQAPGSGTLRYRSPEQSRGQAIDGRSDLYSVAVVLYELLHGRRLRPVEPPVGPVGRSAWPPDVDGLPDGLAKVLKRGLHPTPSRRFQSAAHFARALGALDAGHDVRKTRAVRPTRAKSPWRKA